MKTTKRKLNPEFEKYARAFHEKNKQYFKESLKQYNNLIKSLKAEIGFKKPCEIEFELLLKIKNENIKEVIIDVGFNFYDLKKVVRKKEVSEFLVQNEGKNLQFLKICEDVYNYCRIADTDIDIDALLDSIKRFQEANLDEEGMRNLHLRIKSYQHSFNNNHLKKFAQRLFGMEWKEIVAVSEQCFEQTFNSYATILISKEGTTYTKKDGTKST